MSALSAATHEPRDPAPGGLLGVLTHGKPSRVVDAAIATILGLVLLAVVGQVDQAVIATLVFVVAPIAIRRTWPVALLALAGVAIVATDARGGVVDVVAFRDLRLLRGQRPAALDVVAASRRVHHDRPRCGAAGR